VGDLAKDGAHRLVHAEDLAEDEEPRLVQIEDPAKQDLLAAQEQEAAQPR